MSEDIEHKRSTTLNAKVQRYAWPELAAGETGAPVNVSGLECKSIQVTGNFDRGAIVLLGSNDDGKTFVPLHGPDGFEVAFTTEGIYEIDTFMEILKPMARGGTATKLDVILLARSL